MRILALLFVMFLTASAHAEVPAAADFLKEIADVPLPEGFAQEESEPTVYDTPDGRIVETVAEGEGKAEDIAAFYEKTLPELGWKRRKTNEKDTLSFIKEEEKLDLSLHAEDAQIEIQFLLSPAGKN